MNPFFRSIPNTKQAEAAPLLPVILSVTFQFFASCAIRIRLSSAISVSSLLMT